MTKPSIREHTVVVPPRVGGRMRDGCVVDESHDDGSPPYVLEWSDAGRQVLFVPGDGRRDRPSAQPSADEAARTSQSLTWMVTLQIFERGAATTARALLDAGFELPAAWGNTERAHGAPDTSGVSEKVAVSRALRQLADLVMASAADGMCDVRESRRNREIIRPS